MSSTTATDGPPLAKPVEDTSSTALVLEVQTAASVTETDADTKFPSSDSAGLDSKLAKLDLSSEGANTDDSDKAEAANSPSDATNRQLEKKNEKGDGEGTQKGPKKTPTKPYVNPERFLTGGSPREKLSPEELEKKIARIRENNEKIKQRQLTIQADEDAFRATQSAELKKQAQNKKIQEGINRNREQNAQRKMDRMNNREWDSNKKRPGQTQGQGQKDKVTEQVASTEGATTTTVS